ncbi:MAG: urease accessory protein UreF [Ancylobacter novellus]|uniref:Urease accessory protein UreF n=1 Tax=Ancylobacter novellus TaxID=921 RepID=A0A2W5SHK6_ANCNO|nr:MAG: urease accessory protein UreF [Ancylobacter novellus]
MQTSALLLALRFGDTAFPSGGFAFSQGLEGLAAVYGARPDAAAIAGFLEEQLRHRWGPAERVTLVQCHRAHGDIDAIAALDRDLDLSSFSEPLRLGARRNGAALLATHGRLGTQGAAAYRAQVMAGVAPGTLAAVQGLLWHGCGLDEASAELLAGYQLVAGGLAAATRLGLIGALGAQQMMPGLLDTVASVCAEPVAPDAEPAGFAPFSDIAAARQARLPLRLFSN